TTCGDLHLRGERGARVVAIGEHALHRGAGARHPALEELLARLRHAHVGIEVEHGVVEQEPQRDAGGCLQDADLLPLALHHHALPLLGVRVLHPVEARVRDVVLQPDHLARARVAGEARQPRNGLRVL
ncbi:MAG: hypothetical protein ACK559_06450, partial [bacterium]